MARQYSAAVVRRPAEPIEETRVARPRVPRNSMSRKLLPLAAGLLVAGAAQAQTTVTLYGIADGDLRVDHTAIGTLKSLGSGGEASSRWGLRGTEDLGNGMKAVFNVEQDFDLSDKSAPQGNIAPTTPTSPTSSTGSRLFGRRAIVGLNVATFGEVRVGRETRRCTRPGPRPIRSRRAPCRVRRTTRSAASRASTTRSPTRAPRSTGCRRRRNSVPASRRAPPSRAVRPRMAATARASR